jgi:hypothetical protein
MFICFVLFCFVLFQCGVVLVVVDGAVRVRLDSVAISNKWEGVWVVDRQQQSTVRGMVVWRL